MASSSDPINNLLSKDWQTSLSYITGDEGLGGILSSGEENIKTVISNLQSVNAADLNQADLLAAQQAIQSWSLVSGMITSMMRAVGDGLSKVVQNIR